MKKLFTRCRVLVLATLLFISFVWSGSVFAGTVRLPEVSTPGSGNVLITVDGTFYLAERDAILNRLNAIRQEAQQLGFVNRYVPLKWSQALEEAARTRAAEALLTLDHTRLTTKSWSTAGSSARGENLAWNNTNDSVSFLAAIEQWYGEKANYIKKRNGESNYGVTGHYESMINPDFTYTGLGSFDIEANKWTTVAQWFSTTPSSEASLTSSGSHTQVLEALATDISQLKMNGSATLAGPTQFSVTGTLTSSQADSDWLRTYARWVYPTLPVGFYSGVTWTSSQPTVATVDNTGLVAPKGNGKTVITATVGGQSVQMEVSVKGISGIEPITASTKSGSPVNLPGTVRTTWSDGTVTQEAVTWSAVDTTNTTNSPIVRTVTGTVSGTSLQATARVTIHGISSFDTVTLSTKSGTAPILPAAVTARWTDGTTSQETITWQAVSAASYNVTSPTQFTVAGTSSKTSQQARALVSVAAVSELKPIYLSIHSGQVPSLPTTVQAVWSDGSTSQTPVTWDYTAPTNYQSNQKKQVAVSGRIGQSNLSATAYVTVHAIASVSPVSVTTSVGQAPVLPATVSVTWTDGTNSEVAVSWSTILKTLYTHVVTDSQFEVKGSLRETNLPALAQVKVIAQTIPLYRLYHPGLKVHLYTKDVTEYTILATRGWLQEGLAWQTSASQGDVVYRMYHPGLKVHLYTKDANEYRILSTRGWQQEGAAFRSYGTVPIYRLYNPDLKKHLYTRDANEYKVLATRGWLQEGIAFYAVR